ncbi:MAG TPA: DUF5985 family protein [Thermoanaerobaculia bacterium]|nr:DUF5985 family protein [Thermoanaerobaculia bacterium]
MIGFVVYGLCVITSATCAALLLRGYARNRVPLLLWSGLCFLGLALNNLLLFIDVQVIPLVDLSAWRTLPALVGVLLLLYGMIWETR